MMNIKKLLTHIFYFIFCTFISSKITICMYPKLIEKYDMPYLNKSYDHLKISKNGDIIAITKKNKLQIFNIKKEELMCKIILKNKINEIKLTQSGKYIIVQHGEQNITVYNTKKQKRLIKYGHNKAILPIFITKNGKYAASICLAMVLKVYSVKIKKIIMEKCIHKTSEFLDTLYMTENGKYVVTLLNSSIIQIYNTNTKTLIFKKKSHPFIKKIAISKNGIFFAYNNLKYADKISITKILQKNTCKKLKSYKHSDSITYLKCILNKFILSGSCDGTLKIYDIDQNKLISTIKTKKKSFSIGTSDDYKKLVLQTEFGRIEKYQMPNIISLTYENYIKKKQNKKKFKNNLYNKIRNKKYKSLCDLIIKH